MSLELLGGRVLAPYFGSSIYVWGSIITVFMLSLALGYLAGGRLSVRQPSLSRFGTIFLIGAILMYPLILYADPAMQWQRSPREATFAGHVYTSKEASSGGSGAAGGGCGCN